MNFRNFTVLAMTLLASMLQTTAGELPIDPDIRYGKLPNGLTYYVRHNAVPAGMADVHLIYQVGSTVERDDERGFAHLLEHVSFTGTKNYPDNTIIDFIENHGAVFGSDINAVTEFDFTTYKFSNIRMANEATLDTILLMMRDMACELTIDSAGLKKERDIVIEEWRSNKTLQERIFNTLSSQLMPGNAYSTRMPIGDMDIVGKATREQILDFYHRWYRPELMAVVAVGDFDPDRMTERIIQVMSPLTNPTGAPAREWATVPDNKGLQTAVMNDDEVIIPQFSLAFKYDDMPFERRNTAEYAELLVSRSLLESLLTLRLQELIIDPLSPIGTATADDEGMFSGNVNTKRELGVTFSSRGDSLTECVSRVMRFIAAARDKGFTAGELGVVKRQLITFYDNALADLGKHENAIYVDEYSRHYRDGGYIPGIKIERDLCVDIINRIEPTHINNLLRRIVTPDNAYLIAIGPTGYSMPQSDIFAGLYKSALNTNYPEPADDVDYTAPLLAAEPKAGTVVSREEDSLAGATILHMSNGATVVLKPTDFKNDEVLFGAYARGGTLSIDQSLTATANFLNLYMGTARPGGWEQMRLIKRMAADYCNLDFDVNDDHHGFEGSCNTAGLPTLLQLSHLFFTDTQPDSNAFNAVKQTIVNSTRNMLNDSDMALNAALLNNITNDNYRLPPTVANIEDIDVNRSDKLWREFTANAAEYTFAIVGNFDPQKAEELACRYIGSLPGHEFEPRHLRRPVINDTCRAIPVALKQISARCPVKEFMAGDCVYSYRNELMMEIYDLIAGGLLNYFLREDMHLTYGIEVTSCIDKPAGKWETTLEYDVSHESLMKVVNITGNVLLAIRDGRVVDQAYFDSVKKQMQQRHDLEVKTNAYWLNALLQRARGIDAVAGVDDFYHTVTLDEFNEFVAKMEETTIVSVFGQN